MFNRRLIVAACLLVLVLAGWAAPLARAQDGPFYFPRTGHHLTNDQGFLAFWQAHNGEQLLGFPVTEAFGDADAAQQYFERGRLEQYAAADGSTQVRTGRVGAEFASATWKRFAPSPPHKPVAGEQVFADTGHTLREPFLSFWRAGGGAEFFGPPISEPLWEMTVAGRRQVQYFERARLEREAGMSADDSVVVGDLGAALAAIQGVDTAPVGNIGYASYGPGAVQGPDIAPLNPPRPTAAPVVAPPAAAPPVAQPRRPSSGESRSIVVNLSKQWMYAYEGDEIVFDAPVSTGRDGMETPTGTYAIYTKLPKQTMDGVTNGEYWIVPNVPNVMYFNGGVALHGTYWHNRFGTGARLSHGCVNLPLKAAAWLYAWASVGTPVRVTY